MQELMRNEQLNQKERKVSRRALVRRVQRLERLSARWQMFFRQI